MNPLTAENRLSTHDSVQDVLLDEDFVPPHKSAAFVPYDILFSVNGAVDDWDEDRATDILDDALENYHTIVSIEENTYSNELDGDTVVFLSLSDGIE